MSRLIRAQIDVKALKNNLSLLKKWTGAKNFFCPMVKSNAYGHDDVLVSQVAEKEGVSAVGVARVEEGVHLRQNGIKIPILTFVPLLRDSAELARKHGLTPVLGRVEDVEILAAVRTSDPIGIHLEFNTGMQRLGFDRADLPKLRQLLRDNPRIQVEGVCTHFVYGEEAADPNGFSAKQLQAFLEMTQDFPGVRHAHKSASLVSRLEKGKPAEDGIGARPGIALYGLAHEGTHVGPGLVPVLRWVSELATVHVVEKGETVSYGGRWKAARRSTVGVVPVGYGDGYMRVLSGKSHMLFRGARVPVVGTVCMDYTIVDLTDVCQDRPPKHGEEIVILGRQGGEEISAMEIGAWAGTIAYEVVSNIRQRVPREAI